MKDERSTEKLDALLQRLGPPLERSGGAGAAWRRSDAEWDDAAAVTSQEAVRAGAGDPKIIDSVLAAPALEPEAGEPSSVVGDSKMSSDRDPPSKAGGSSGPTSKRPSLKELAERVSKTPPPPSVAPGRASVPEIPAATMKAGTSSPPTATPLPIAAPASVRVVEAQAPVSSAPASSAPASSPPPSLPEPAAAQAAAPTSKAPATLPTGVTPIQAAKKDEGSGKTGGIVIALLGIAAAAAVFFYMKSRHAPETAPAPAAKQEETAPATTAKPAEKPPEAAKSAEASNDKPGDGALDINALGDATAQPSGVALGGPLPTASAAPSAVAAADPSKTGPVKVNPDGSLDDAMKKAAGPDDAKQEAAPASEAAAPKNLPDAPPQGSVTAAIGAVKGAAKACVAGADDVSSATVTFGSSGAVQSVSVGGWAAGKPAASCIQSALKGANVGPFSKPTFTVPVTIRP